MATKEQAEGTDTHPPAARQFAHYVGPMGADVEMDIDDPKTREAPKAPRRPQ